MKSIGNWIQLFPLYFKVKWRLLKEERKVQDLFYHHVYFRLLDSRMKKEYFLKNPYQISKRYLQKKGCQDVHQYGETPITSLDLIAKACDLTLTDTWIELGCGRGRGLFFLSEAYGCKCIGVEWVPEFVEKAQKISSSLPHQNTEFHCTDMTEFDLSGATVIYLYGTCLDEATLETLLTRLTELKPKTKIVSVSYPLTDYRKEKFALVNQLTVDFPWGSADVFIQEVQ